MATAISLPNRPNVRAAISAKQNIWVYLPVVLLFYACLLPPEVAFYAGPLRVGAYRAVLLLLLPFVFLSFIGGRTKFGLIDLLMLVVALWIPVSFAQNYDWSVGLEAGGSQTIDMMAAYLVGRCAIRNFSQLRHVLLLIAPGIFIAGFALMIESIGGSLYIRETAQKIFGGTGEIGNELRYERRLGLLRSYGPFTHPIHAGVFLSSFIPLYFLLFSQYRRKFIGLAFGILAFFSLSSAGIVGMVLNLAFVGYDWLQQRVKELSWALGVFGLFIIVSAVQFFSTNGVVPVIYRYLTLNPRTGWYRTQIWNYAGADAWRHPWFGKGYESFLAPAWFGNTNTIDAHYLAMALKYGVVPSVLYFSLAIWIIILISRRVFMSSTNSARRGYLALAVSLSTVIVLLFTVAIWGSMLAWFNMILGICISLVRNPSNLHYRLNRL